MRPDPWSGREKLAKQGSRSAASPLGGATEPGVDSDCSGAAMGVQGPMPLLVVLLVCTALGKPGELRRCTHKHWGGWGKVGDAKVSGEEIPLRNTYRDRAYRGGLIFCTSPPQVPRTSQTSSSQVTDGLCGGLGVCKSCGKGSGGISSTLPQDTGGRGCMGVRFSSDPRSHTHVPWGRYRPASELRRVSFFFCPSALWPQE